MKFLQNRAYSAVAFGIAWLVKGEVIKDMIDTKKIEFLITL